MLSTEEATSLIATHLGSTTRARHSMFVGFLMAKLAEALEEDRLLWEVTGLCHDLDFEETAEDRSRHGMVTAEWLKDDLPATALLAIQSHDHRTGVSSESPLSVALRLADAVAVGELDIGREEMVQALCGASPVDRLGEVLAERPYLAKLIIGPADELSIPLASLAAMFRTAPEQ